MHIHQDWGTPAFAASPVAAAVGPFPMRPLLQAWWEKRAGTAHRLLLVEGDGALLPLCEGRDGLMFLGEEDLVDYHSPLGEGVPDLVAEFAATLRAGAGFRLDSLPREAAEAVGKGLREAGIEVDAVEHVSAAVLDLPDDFDGYLAALGKKDRHELRRKRRRFEAELGPPMLDAAAPQGEAFDHFVRLHRAAAGEKGSFMTGEMAAFFSAVGEIPGTRIDLLRDGAGAVVAAAFGFVDDDGYYLYNSAYDPAAGSASPGVVLLGLLIERAIGLGLHRFDFLKGDERYKYRLGARPRPLYEIEGAA